MKRVLVTGAGGYIGTTLVPALLERGYAVRAVDRYFFGDDVLPANNGQLEVVKDDARKLTAGHFNEVDYVIDLAAVSNDPSGELFQHATWQINHEARARAARLAKKAGVDRYIFPSSCSIYGFQDQGVVCKEGDPINPLTTYARANRKAEEDILPLADDDFTVVVVRQSTVYGLSPRMRFDLAINGMTFGAWKNNRLPLLRDGTQWRPMVHVKDTVAAQIFMLEYGDPAKINGEIFNVGSADNNYQLQPLAHTVAGTINEVTGREIDVEWYGEPDHRSYQVDFQKIESLGWKAQRTARDAVLETCKHLEAGELDRTDRTITLQWYKTLDEWYHRIKDLEMYHGMLDIDA